MNDITQPDRGKMPPSQVGALGTINNPALSQPIECVVLDLSATGARLRVPNVDYVPDAFKLSMEGDDFSTECIVDWRSDAELGVIFEVAPQ